MGNVEEDKAEKMTRSTWLKRQWSPTFSCEVAAACA